MHFDEAQLSHVCRAYGYVVGLTGEILLGISSDRDLVIAYLRAT
jgi:hypothetical protein